MSTRWPERLWIVRHGESAGNVARYAAHASGAARIALDVRDVDVPLSPRGEEQACALGHWFADMPQEERPEMLLVSPYARAQATARLFIEGGGLAGDCAPCIDERLREKEFGILDGLTSAGIAEFHPDQVAFRRLLGKFYHRPPGGESWCDVIFRLRAVMDTIALHHAGKPVMIVAHQVVVLCMRYIVENMDEEQILAIDREGDVANCSVTEYRFDPEAYGDGGLVLVRYNATASVAQEATVTTEPSRGIGARG